MVMDVTPTLPGPQMWFDVFPWTKASEAEPARAHKSRGRKMPPQPPDQRAAMVTAYALIEDMARAGYAERGRGFLLCAAYKGSDAEPYITYMTLDQPEGE